MPRTKQQIKTANARAAAAEARTAHAARATEGNAIVAERKKATEDSQAVLQDSFLSVGSFAQISITCTACTLYKWDGGGGKVRRLIFSHHRGIRR